MLTLSREADKCKPRIPQKVLTLSREADKCEPLASGSGDCTDTAPSDWFNTETQIEASIVVTVDGASSNTKYVQIMPKPVHAALTAAGMYVDMIESPRYPGGAVQVDTRVCKHGIRRPSPWVSDSMPVCDTL